MSLSPNHGDPDFLVTPEPEPEGACEGCGESRPLARVPGYAWPGGPACWVWICATCAEGGDPRERGDDDGVEYGHPGDRLRGDE